MSNVTSRLGARIKELRLAVKLSQEQLAERAGVSYKFIGDVERGKGNPTIAWLDAIARGLGVSIKDLIVDDEPATMRYPPLSGREYSVMREAMSTIDGLIKRYAPGRPKPRKHTSKSR